MLNCNIEEFKQAKSAHLICKRSLCDKSRELNLMLKQEINDAQREKIMNKHKNQIISFDEFPSDLSIAVNVISDLLVEEENNYWRNYGHGVNNLNPTNSSTNVFQNIPTLTSIANHNENILVDEKKNDNNHNNVMNNPYIPSNENNTIKNANTNTHFNLDSGITSFEEFDDDAISTHQSLGDAVIPTNDNSIKANLIQPQINSNNVNNDNNNYVTKDNDNYPNNGSPNYNRVRDNNYSERCPRRFDPIAYSYQLRECHKLIKILFNTVVYLEQSVEAHLSDSQTNNNNNIMDGGNNTNFYHSSNSLNCDVSSNNNGNNNSIFNINNTSNNQWSGCENYNYQKNNVDGMDCYHEDSFNNFRQNSTNTNNLTTAYSSYTQQFVDNNSDFNYNKYHYNYNNNKYNYNQNYYANYNTNTNTNNDNNNTNTNTNNNNNNNNNVQSNVKSTNINKFGYVNNNSTPTITNPASSPSAPSITNSVSSMPLSHNKQKNNNNNNNINNNDKTKNSYQMNIANGNKSNMNQSLFLSN